MISVRNKIPLYCTVIFIDTMVLHYTDTKKRYLYHGILHTDTMIFHYTDTMILHNTHAMVLHITSTKKQLDTYTMELHHSDTISDTIYCTMQYSMLLHKGMAP